MRVGFEGEDVAVVEETAQDAGAGRSVEGKAQGADGDFGVVADAHGGSQAPDDDAGVFLGEGGVGGGAEFPVEFVMIGVVDEGLAQDVCRLEGADGVGGEEGRETLLLGVVAAFDFAFGLGSGSVAQGDAVKAQSLAELGESVRGMGEKEGVIIHIESVREAVGEEGAGKKIEMGGERFGGVKARPGVEPGGIVEDVEKGLFFGTAGQE